MPNRVRPDQSLSASPEETRIYQSRPKGIFLLLVLLAGAGFGIYQIAIKPDFWGGYVYLVGSIVAIVGVVTYYFGPRNPQLVISKEGIQNEQGLYRSWAAITYAEVQWIKKINSTDHYLEYGYTLGHKTLKFRTEIRTWDITPKQLEKLLKDYEQQYQSSRFIGN
ncbi:MAG: hypothetical protein KTR30_10220 [Saprospiraceae bacterium]|nr:hypothetical protein [Saprospiraceae bacterium]